MKIVTPSGKVLQGSIHSLCVGVVARTIELEPQDIDEMLRLHESAHMVATLRQLKGRFESERTGFRKPTMDKRIIREYDVTERYIGTDMIRLSGRHNYDSKSKEYVMDLHIEVASAQGWELVSIAFEGELPARYTAIMRRPK